MRRGTGWMAFIMYPVLLSVVGVIMFFWALGDSRMPFRDRWSFAVTGLGLIMGGGFSEALRHDPADCDVFPFRVLARVGFLVAGVGFGLGMVIDDDPITGVMAAAVVIMPVTISFIRLLWKHRKEKP